MENDDVFPICEWHGRAILLIDLDAFFASVEQLDHPGWRGKPVIVGGDPEKRGVVSTASYEAREYGVHSAMASSMAKRLCPDAIWTSGSFSRYREVSNKIMDIIRAETPHVQQVSIDEAFADVTPNNVNTENPVAIAMRIQLRVEELGVTCSIGVGTTKSIAKIASDMDKPRGLTVVYPGSERSFLDPLPVRLLSGIGKASEATLMANGIETLGDFARADEKTIGRLLGKNGRVMQSRARGIEDGDIEPIDEVKSVSNETSFAENLTQRDDIVAAIHSMASKVARRLRQKGMRGRTVALKIRYANRKVRTVQRSLREETDDDSVLMEQLEDMLDEVWSYGIEVWLVGVRVTGFGEDDAFFQASLFDDCEDGECESRKRKRESLNKATDLVRDRFGEHAVSFGRELRTANNTTGTSAKNPADYK